MDILDSQVHISPGTLEATLSAMDALGITAVLLDEYWGSQRSEDFTQTDPGFCLPNGSWRFVHPTAELAGITHPERFSSMVRVDRRDPDLESWLRVLASTPYTRAVRFQAAATLGEAEAFRKGLYAAAIELAADAGFPVFLLIPGYVEWLGPYAERFPEVSFVIDHCGMGSPALPPNRPEAELRRTRSVDYFDEVLKLADYPNVALKWSHPQGVFCTASYPYADLRPLLRRAITAFGADRLMWASDKTVAGGLSWGDLLYSIRDDPELDLREKEWILGGSARRFLKWPVTEPLR